MNQFKQTPRVKLATILVAGLLFRLALLAFVHNPGLHDPVHYYNLGARLAGGQGFTIDYLWHYNNIASDGAHTIVHPIDHWMPLAGAAAGIGIALFGESARAALFIFALAGALLPLMVYCAAKQLALSESAALIAAAFAAFLPDLLYASLRTDTTILNAFALCLSALLFNSGLRTGQRYFMVLCGVAAGLAYLTRNDSILILPVYIAVAALRLIWSEQRMTFRASAALMFTLLASFLLTVAPWLLRNLSVLNMLGPAETSHMFFMVEHSDHYAYGLPITLESMLQRQSLAELLAKRAFELLAACKQIVDSFTLPLFAAVAAGLWLMIRLREKKRLLRALPALLWLLGILLAYPILLPLKSQAGSFEKAFLSVLPLLLPFAALSLEHFLLKPLPRLGVAAILLLWLATSSYGFVREETAKANLYYDSIGVLIETLADLPDLTGDGRLRLMAQDPYVFSYFGYESIMTPLASRADTLDLARRYQIDYLMMPPGRPALDALYLSQETDERFVLVAHLPEAGEKPFELYRFVHA